MDFKKKKTILTTIVTLAILTSIMLLPTTVQAQTLGTGAPVLPAWQTTPPAGVTPNITIATSAFMSVNPPTVGIGQPVLVNLWLEPPIQYNRFLSGYTVTITKPDGTTETIGPMNSYQGDATAWFQYPVDQVGNYKFKFDFAGNYFPAGVYFSGKVYPNVAAIGPYTASAFSGPIFLESAFYQPSSSPETTITVQSDMVASWPAIPLPTDYWTRPIPIGYREWWVIGGQYPFVGQGGGPDWPANTNTFASNYKFTPYVQGPTSSHIAWKIQGAFGGISGGQYGYRSNGPGESTYSGTPNIIFQGRAYQNVPGVIDGVAQNVWRCYDIRTGQIYWEIAGITQVPTLVTLNKAGASVPGAGETGMGQGSFSLMYIGSSRLIKYNPWNGAVQVNVSLPFSSGTLYNDPYALSVQDLGANATNAPGGRYRLINWTIVAVGMGGATTGITVLNNISYPMSSLGTTDYESMISVYTGSITPAGAGTAQGQYIMGVSLTSGQLLWNVTTNDIFYSSSTGVADHGKYAVRMLGGWWDCWDLNTGKLVWQSEKLTYPWGDFGAYTVASYGGYFYDFSYAGINAIDWNTGKVAWNFIAPATPFEEPWYPTAGWFSNSPQIADGKLYYGNGEHSPTEPLARDWKLWCLDAVSGKEIWNITGGGSAGAIADGYLTYENRYDGYMYVYGKGKSATSVTASPKTIAKGTEILIEGNVMDISPAQPNTPCVSKDSMTTQMEYLHMQYPVDGLYHNVSMTGVPVTVTAIDSKNNVVNVGTVTTNPYYGTFSIAWSPPNQEVYTITASFKGDDSYGSSSGSTAISVGPAVEQSNNSNVQQTIPDYTMTIIYGVIAIIVVVAIVGALLFIALRKR